MGASGAESLNVAASIFMGQTEAPLTIRPFLPEVTRSELMTIMTSGMAHVSGGMMAAYIAYGIEAKHLLAAVIMTAPGTILLAKMLVPETEKPLTAGRVEMAEMERDANVLGAISRGTVDGLHLALNVAAMLISFIALIYLVDGCFGGGPQPARLAWHRRGFPRASSRFSAGVFSPVAWVIGVPWRDCRTIANLLGLRMVTNELVAFQRLGPMQAHARSALVHDRHLRALRICEFQLDRHSDRRHRRARAQQDARNSRDLGLRALLAGTMANLMSASIVGIMLR